MQGTNTSYVQPGSQFSQQNIQRNAQQRVPFQGQFNGNPRGANNMGRRNNNPFGFQGQGMAPAWSQQNNLGRYRPPTMNGMGGYNSNQWNDMGGMDYNLPGSYGSPLGQGQFAPMPRQFQQFMMGGMGGGFGGMGLDRVRQQQIADFGMGGQGGFIPGPDSDFLTGNRFRGGGFGMQMQQMNDLSQFNMGGQGGMGGGDPYFDQMVNVYFGNQQPRYDGGSTEFGFSRQALQDDPRAFQEWAQQAINAPGQDPTFANQIRAQLSAMGMGAPEGKGGSPLMEQPQPAPTWDSPFNRSYNMAALRQMMGGG
jgi:hypothetical protein